MSRSSSLDLAPQPIYSSWREVPMEDAQLVDLCHVVRGVVDACVEQPRWRIDSSVALQGIPHNNRLVPSAIRDAVGQTRFGSMNVLINGASLHTGLISVDVSDLDNPARRLRFAEQPGLDQFLVTDTHDRASRARGRAVALGVGADAVAYWLAEQATGNAEQAEALVDGSEGRAALDTPARMLEQAADTRHSVTVAGSMIMPGVLLHAQLATSSRLRGRRASTVPLVRQYSAWLTAHHDDPEFLPPGIDQINQTAMVCFTPENGVLAHPMANNDSSTTSVRIGLEAYGRPDASTEWLTTAAQHTTGDEMFGHFQNAQRLIAA